MDVIKKLLKILKSSLNFDIKFYKENSYKFLTSSLTLEISL